MYSRDNNSSNASCRHQNDDDDIVLSPITFFDATGTAVIQQIHKVPTSMRQKNSQTNNLQQSQSSKRTCLSAAVDDDLTRYRYEAFWDTTTQVWLHSQVEWKKLDDEVKTRTKKHRMAVPLQLSSSCFNFDKLLVRRPNFQSIRKILHTPFQLRTLQLSSSSYYLPTMCPLSIPSFIPRDIFIIAHQKCPKLASPPNQKIAFLYPVVISCCSSLPTKITHWHWHYLIFASN